MKNILVALSLFLAFNATAQITNTCIGSFQDTVKYVDSKTSSYAGISINLDNSSATSGYAAYAQKFEAPDTVSVSGFCFYGVMDSGGSDNALAVMYSVNGAGAPDTIVDSISVFIPYFGTGYSGAMNHPSIKHCAIFPAPVVWEGDYFLSVENFKKNSQMFLARNIDGNGDDEAITYTFYEDDALLYDDWYQIYGFGAGWDFDMIYQPIVNYEVELTTSSDTALCFGDTINLDVTYSIDDSLMYNKFYNPNFGTYTGSSESYTFDYDDGSATTSDTSHVFDLSSGSLTITNAASIALGGWTLNSANFNCYKDVEVTGSLGLDLGLDRSLCIGDTAFLDAGAGYDSYLWSDLSINDSLVTLVSGDYSVVVDLNGCQDEDTVTLTFGDLVVDLGSDTTLCLNQMITFDAGAFDSYSWNTGQLTQTVQAGPFTTPGESDYIVNVENGNCSGSDTLTLTVDNCLGVDDKLVGLISVYPNPSAGVLNVDLGSVNFELAYIEIVTTSGSVVHNQLLSSNKESIQLTVLPAGIYFANIVIDGSVGVKKIQIIK